MIWYNNGEIFITIIRSNGKCRWRTHIPIYIACPTFRPRCYIMGSAVCNDNANATEIIMYRETTRWPCWSAIFIIQDINYISSTNTIRQDLWNVLHGHIHNSLAVINMCTYRLNISLLIMPLLRPVCNVHLNKSIVNSNLNRFITPNKL